MDQPKNLKWKEKFLIVMAYLSNPDEFAKDKEFGFHLLIVPDGDSITVYQWRTGHGLRSFDVLTKSGKVWYTIDGEKVAKMELSFVNKLPSFTKDELGL
jgi:hypothetical protein